jgi:hypothetical protein
MSRLNPRGGRMLNTCCQRLDLCRATLLGVRHGRRRYRIDPTALHARRMYHGRQQCRRFDLGRWVGARRTARTAFGRRQRHPRACRCHPGAHGHVKSKRSDDCFVGQWRQSAFGPTRGVSRHLFTTSDQVRIAPKSVVPVVSVVWRPQLRRLAQTALQWRDMPLTA